MSIYPIPMWQLWSIIWKLRQEINWKKDYQCGARGNSCKNAEIGQGYITSQGESTPETVVQRQVRLFVKMHTDITGQQARRQIQIIQGNHKEDLAYEQIGVNERISNEAILSLTQPGFCIFHQEASY